MEVWRGLVDGPFEVPQGRVGVTLTGLDRGLLERLATAAGELLGLDEVVDWSPAYWMPVCPAVRAWMVLPSRSVELKLPTWRLPRFLGFDTSPPEDHG